MTRNGSPKVPGTLVSSSRCSWILETSRRSALVRTTASNGLHFGAVFAIAAREAGLEHVVSLSQWLAHPDHPSLFTREVWLNDEIIKLCVIEIDTTLNKVVEDDFAGQRVLEAHNRHNPHRGGARRLGERDRDLLSPAVTYVFEPTLGSHFAKSDGEEKCLRKKLPKKESD